MIRLVTGGLILLPFLGLFLGAATAATDFQDIPYLQARINQVLEQEPTGAEIEWRNEATGNAGVIRVLKTYFPSPDAPCRDYVRTTRRPGGGESLVRGTGCRDASGRWGLKEMEETEAPSSEPPSSEPPSPEPWSPVPPAGEPELESASPSLPGGQSQQSGGQGGAQTQNQSQSRTQSQSQSQSQTGAEGQAGQASQTGTGLSTSVLPNASETEAAPQATSEPPEPAPPAPRESAPSLPEIEMPTRSE